MGHPHQGIGCTSFRRWNQVQPFPLESSHEVEVVPCSQNMQNLPMKSAKSYCSTCQITSIWATKLSTALWVRDSWPWAWSIACIFIHNFSVSLTIIRNKPNNPSVIFYTTPRPPHTPFPRQPHQLPPSHNITHHVHLLPNSSPINVKPYRYPYSQKNELKRQVIVMLQSNII